MKFADLPDLPSITANLDKALYPTIVVILAIINSLLGQDVGFSPGFVHDLNIGLLILTPLSAYLAPHGYATTTVPPGHVVVPAAHAKPDATVVFSRPPST